MSVKLWKSATSNAFQTTLNGDITDSASTITLTSVTGLTAPGVLVIDRIDPVTLTATPTLREYITFTGISSNDLTGVTRGVAGSTAQSHLSNHIVEENFSVTHWGDLLDFLAVSHDSAGKIVTSSATISTLDVVGTLHASAASVLGLKLGGTTETHLGSDAEGDIYYRNSSNLLARLAIGSAGQYLKVASGLPSWASLSALTNVKVGGTTRDLTTASGTQAVTGLGFQPTGVIFFAVVQSTTRGSWGMDDGTNKLSVRYQNSFLTNDSSNSIHYNDNSSNSYAGYVDSFDADGFTINWTKSGSPTGTLQILYFAIG